MGYMKIPNLYKDKRVLDFRRVYASEKIHGTSAAVKWDGRTITLHSGGEKHDRFSALFDLDELAEKFAARFGERPARVHGESYGGKMQRMSTTYGVNVCFTAFEVCVGESWLDPDAARCVAVDLGFEFVPMWLVEAPTVEEMVARLDELRDQPSVIAGWRGIEGEKVSEGIVIRPPYEVRLNNGGRIIAKHKSASFSETRSPRKVLGDNGMLTKARAIADEWVTEMRLDHVLDKLKAGGKAIDITCTGDVVRAMVADVVAESKDEIADSREARSAIGRAAASMYKNRLNRDGVANG